MKINSLKDDFDICVMCGTVTEEPVSKPIENREFCEVGCGQLCRICYIKLHGEENINNVLTNEKIILAVERSRKKSKNK